MTPSARSPPPAWKPGGIASDSDIAHTDVYDGDSDEVVSDEDGNPAYTTRSGAHGEKQFMFTAADRSICLTWRSRSASLRRLLC